MIMWLLLFCVNTSFSSSCIYLKHWTFQVNWQRKPFRSISENCFTFSYWERHFLYSKQFYWVTKSIFAWRVIKTKYLWIVLLENLLCNFTNFFFFQFEDQYFKILFPDFLLFFMIFSLVALFGRIKAKS